MGGHRETGSPPSSKRLRLRCVWGEGDGRGADAQFAQSPQLQQFPMVDNPIPCTLLKVARQGRSQQGSGGRALLQAPTTP